MELEDIEGRIKALEEQKSKLIDEIKKNYARIKYKKYEDKALEPFLKKTEHIRTEPVRRRLRQLEFKIATQAYTPAIERQLVKEVKKVEAELKKMRQIERARRKKRLVAQDIEEAEKRIEEIEESLKKIRTELKELYSKVRTAKTGKKHGVVFGEKHDTMVSLEDIVVIEEEGKKEKEES